MTTLRDALGPAAHPLAGVVAWWRLCHWQRGMVRLVAPGLGRRLDDLCHSLSIMIGLP